MAHVANLTLQTASLVLVIGMCCLTPAMHHDR